MMGFFISILIILGIQIVIEIFLASLGVPTLYIEICIDLVLAFLFSYFNYRGSRKEAIKDPLFHRNVAITFAILILISLLFYILMREIKNLRLIYLQHYQIISTTWEV